MGLMKLAEESAHRYGRKFVFVDLNHQSIHLEDIFGESTEWYPEAVVVVKLGKRLSCYLFEGDCGSKMMCISHIPHDYDWKCKPRGGAGLELPYHSMMRRRDFEKFWAYYEAQRNYESMFKKDGSLR